MRSGTPELAGPVGAVNVVRVGPGGRTSGNILDGEGLLSGPRTAGQAIAGRRALIVGAGGVGSAITFAVTNAGVRELAVFDVATDRARQPLARLTAAGSAAHVRPPIAAEFDVVINASPADMQPGDPLPIDCARLDASAIVADVVIQAGFTPRC
jgi:shikimate dehydrogenase